MGEIYRISDAVEDQYHGFGPAMAAIRSGEVVGLVYFRDILHDHDDGHSVPAHGKPINDEEIGKMVCSLSELGTMAVGICSCGDFFVL